MERVGTELKNTLTIVKKGLLRVTSEEWKNPGEHFQCLKDTALSLILDAISSQSSAARANMRRAVLLFDCLLRVINEPPVSSTITFATERFQLLQGQFYGALGSERFIDASKATKLSWARDFYRVLTILNSKTPVMLAGYRPKVRYAIPTEFVQAFEKLNFDTEQIQRLRPYLLQNKSGIEYNVLLATMVPVLGQDFTDQFHEGLKTIARPRANDSALRDFGTTFARFVCYLKNNQKPVSAELLIEPSFVQTLLVDFMEFHFTKMIRRQGPVQEGTLASLQKLWSRYQSYWGTLVRMQVLAAPSVAFPNGNSKLLWDKSIAHRRIKTDESGNSTIVTEKLITPVPLHLSDEEATKLIFENLRDDFAAIQSWLRDHLNSFFNDFELGQALAAEIKTLPENDALEQATRHVDGDAGLALAVKYFKEKHSGYIDTVRVRTPVYPKHTGDGRIAKRPVARYLGIPSRQEAMVFIAFLASHDGRFSEAALANAQLTDIAGKRINAVETDAGLILTVLKERVAGDGWQDVVLNGEAADVVRKWIEVTAPLRSYMELHQVNGWQNLIIYTGSPMGAPSHFTRSSNIHSTFRNFAITQEPRLGSLAQYVTIPRIRSTRGVLVFLESMDIKKMARELGNANETSLRHYLPDSIWDYFATRWLRIFQNLLIVEATKDTSYMQRALHFNSAAEMDEFLRNHAVAPLIPDDKKPREEISSSGSENPKELMVAASPGLFSVLLSIREAAMRATETGRKLTPQGIYWSEFAKLLKSHVESNDFHDRNIKKMMHTAAANLNPTDFMDVVCA